MVSGGGCVGSRRRLSTGLAGVDAGPAAAQIEVDKDPCILLTPSEVAGTLGVTDADGKGADSSIGVNHICCVHGGERGDGAGGVEVRRPTAARRSSSCARTPRPAPTTKW